MDLQTLSQLFATTYNADPNIRKAAELQIRKVNSIFISTGEFELPNDGNEVKISKSPFTCHRSRGR